MGTDRRLAEHQDRRRPDARSRPREGWLLIYHGVLTSCNGFVYSFGAALLDLEQPWKVIYRAAPYLLSPQTLTSASATCPTWSSPAPPWPTRDTGRIAIYYGCADTVTGLAFARWTS